MTRSYPKKRRHSNDLGAADDLPYMDDVAKKKLNGMFAVLKRIVKMHRERTEVNKGIEEEIALLESAASSAEEAEAARKLREDHERELAEQKALDEEFLGRPPGEKLH